MPERAQMTEQAVRPAGIGPLRRPGCLAAMPLRGRMRRERLAEENAAVGSQESLLAANSLPPLPHHPSDERQCAAKRDQEPAKPDQGDERLPPQPKLPPALLVALAEDGIKLAVPARVERRFIGGRRRRWEESALRVEYDC